MKTKIIVVLVAIIGFNSNMFSQENTSKNYVWSYQGQSKQHEIGLYGSLSGNYTDIFSKPAVWIEAKAALLLDHRWGIGIHGSALNYDRTLDKVVNDGTYRLQGGVSGVFVEYLLSLNKNSKFNISWATGFGKVYYQYDDEFAETKPWYQENIDIEKFASNEIGVEYQVKIHNRWWLGAHTKYRFTSPIKLIGTDENFLRTTSGGLSIKYGIY